MTLQNKFFSQLYCPYCEQPIDDKTLIKEPNKFFTTQQVKTFCPHCHGEVDKSVPIKQLSLGLFLMLIMTVCQGYLRELHIMDEFWLRTLGVLFTICIAFPIIFLGVINAPYICSKNTL